MVCSGLSEVIGSWKTMPMSPPRTALSSFSGAFSKSLPLNRISPAGCTAEGGSRRITDKAVTDLPEPDSPTSATVSPLAMSNVAPSTAIVVTPAWRKAMPRFLTERRGVAIAYSPVPDRSHLPPVWRMAASK